MTGKHIVCFSGGESSALVAIEVVRRYGNADVVLLNHDIARVSEDADIKRFKTDVAAYCGLLITYANMAGWDTKDQFDVVVEAGAFKVGNGTALCTNRMKTAPFDRWLLESGVDGTNQIYYGFDAVEVKRIQRRAAILHAKGLQAVFPLAHWPRTIHSTQEVGIRPPLTYSVFRHANCTGCLKAGMQHWYVVWCTRPDVWERGLWAEEEIGYTIIKGHSLLSLVEKFTAMQGAGVPATERVPAGTFWAQAKRIVADYVDDALPCECAQ